MKKLLLVLIALGCCMWLVYKNHTLEESINTACRELAVARGALNYRDTLVVTALQAKDAAEDRAILAERSVRRLTRLRNNCENHLAHVLVADELLDNISGQ